VTKTAIFTKRTLERHRPAEHVETAAEALAISLNETGTLHWPRMAQLTGRSPKQLQRELDSLVYRNPEGDWETADRYLSGDVRAKLKTAQAAATLLDGGSSLAELQGQPLSDLHVAAQGRRLYDDKPVGRGGDRDMGFILSNSPAVDRTCLRGVPLDNWHFSTCSTGCPHVRLGHLRHVAGIARSVGRRFLLSKSSLTQAQSPLPVGHPYRDPTENSVQTDAPAAA